MREARVAPDRASERRPAEPRREAAHQYETVDGGVFAAIGNFLIGHARQLIVLGAVVLLVAAIYGPARQYYVAWRSSAALQEQLDALNQSNEQYKNDISSLQTKEGIEDEARRRGYVSEGETKVVQENVPEEDQETSDAGGSAESDPWYIKLGDTVFNYVAN